jgi:transposase
MARKAYPRDVSDEWALVAPYLTLMTAEAPQREQSLREVCNGRCWIVRAGAAGRLMPHDLPPWPTVDQQRQRWLKAGVCDALVHELRAVLRLAQGRTVSPLGAGLRTVGGDARGLALCGLRYPDAQAFRGVTTSKCITRSSAPWSDPVCEASRGT